MVKQNKGLGNPESWWRWRSAGEVARSLRRWMDMAVEGESWEAKPGKTRAGNRDWTSDKLQGLVHACLLSVQPGLIPWMTVGFIGQLGFFNFLWPLTASTVVAPWWITEVSGFHPVLTPTELLHLLPCFVCTEKRISEFLQTTVCPKSILLYFFSFVLSVLSLRMDKLALQAEKWVWLWRETDCKCQSVLFLRPC